ncbi:hypothetical protein CCR75_008258 [Bremia lactucae]|uniref:Uncharacterized protein n=1 Tax=Bremia lactucae TaxID=4779 RepID=A0A976ILQ1_BRELC|nr:hypothetical protein CCR75_008258 [Bremia lactucae]
MKDIVVAPESLLVPAKPSPQENSPLSQPPLLIDSSTIIAKNDNASDNEYALRYSTAQLNAKVAQVKHEAQVAADAALLITEKELIAQRLQVENFERERDEAIAQCTALRKRLDAVLLEHKKTLLGTREDLELEKLVVTIDMEKAIRCKLQDAFVTQQQALTKAQERVTNLDEQIAKYQKTETVLAQSIAHLQQRHATKDQLRAASVEHVQRELMEHHAQEVATLQEELKRAQHAEKKAQEQVQGLELELKQVPAYQGSVKELHAQVAQLQTEKAVLESKALQIQKADAQLRSQVHAQQDAIATLRQEKDALQRSNKELGEIASDLLQVAERQQAETKTQDDTSGLKKRAYEDDRLILQTRKKRLRLSLG